MYRSLTAQTLHYFARPHWNVRRTPIAGVAAWRGAELAGQTSWRVALSPRQIEELAREKGVPMPACGELAARTRR